MSNKTKLIQIRVDDETAANLEKISKINNKSKSEVIRDLINGHKFKMATLKDLNVYPFVAPKATAIYDATTHEFYIITAVLSEEILMLNNTKISYE